LLLFALVSLWLASGSAVAQGANGNPGVVPINARYAGLTYAEWSARWWQWASANLTLDSPALDLTGEKIAVGQSGPVWFLTWAFTSAVREGTIPVGTALMFPVTNAIAPTREEAEASFDLQANSQADVDGVAIQNVISYRVVSDSFTVTFPEGNLFGLPPGEYGPNYSAGYYILLKPLPVGKHTIHFSFDVVAGPFGTAHLDYTYHLTVVPGK